MKPTDFLMARLPELPMLRRTLFHTFGMLVFEDHFDLALMVVASCQSPGLIASRPSLVTDRTEATFDKVRQDTAEKAFDKLRGICEKEGPGMLAIFGALVKKIEKCLQEPASAKRLTILQAHTVLNLRLERLPTIEELRREVWESKEREAIRKQSVMSEAQVDVALKKGWKAQHGKTPIARKDDFPDEVKLMGLKTTDGKLVRQSQGVFEKLLKSLGKAPKEKEFIDAMVQKKGVLGGPLGEAKFDELIAVLREPVANDRLHAWTRTGVVCEALRAVSLKKQKPKVQVDAMTALSSAIWKLGAVVEQILDGHPAQEQEGGVLARPSMAMVRLVERLASEQGMLPDFAAVCFSMTDNQFKKEVAHIRFSPEETTALAALRTHYLQLKARLGREPKVGELTQVNMAFKLLVEAIEPWWRRFWPCVLYPGLKAKS